METKPPNHRFVLHRVIGKRAGKGTEVPPDEATSTSKVCFWGYLFTVAEGEGALFTTRIKSTNYNFLRAFK